MDLAIAFEDAEPFRLTVDHYLALADAGLLDTAPRTELLDGIIICMSPQASRHTTLSFELAVRLRERLRAIGAPFTAMTTPTIDLRPLNMPEPDVAVLMPRAGDDPFPRETVHLVIEVSNTSRRRDLEAKRDIYARAPIPEYWVVDVQKGVVHRFADPRDGVYRVEPVIPLAGALQSLTMPDLAIDGSGIL